MQKAESKRDFNSLMVRLMGKAQECSKLPCIYFNSLMVRLMADGFDWAPDIQIFQFLNGKINGEKRNLKPSRRRISIP